MMGKLCLYIAVFAVLLSSCSYSKKSNHDFNNQYYISDKQITYTAFLDRKGTNSVFDKAGEITNIYIKNELETDAINEEQALIILLSAGNVPDIILSHRAAIFFTYGKEKFVDIGQYIDRYMPNFNKYLETHGEIKKEITAPDGGIYFVPTVEDKSERMGWYIRRDWLSKLGLKIPENASDFENVLHLFYSADPNGNGKSDEIPYFSNMVDGESLYGIEVLFSLWGANPSWYVENNEIKYGPQEAQFKTAVKNIAAWYRQGLIDKNIFTNDGNVKTEQLQNVGVIFDRVGTMSQYDLNDFEAIKPPSGVILKNQSAAPYGWGISKNCKDILSAVKYMDFWYSEKGMNLANYGLEGVHWEKSGGEPVFKGKEAVNNLKAFGAQSDFGYPRNYDYCKQFYNDADIQAANIFDNSQVLCRKISGIKYTPSEFREYNDKYSEIESYVHENIVKWILGVKDIDDEYDEFLNHMKKIGVERMNQIQKAAYNRAKEEEK